MPASPSETAPSGSVACFVTPVAKSAYGTAEALGDHARDLLDLRLQVRVDVQRAARRLRDELDRAIVVRRAETSRNEADVGLNSLPERLLELGGIVADDDHPCRLQPQ